MKVKLPIWWLILAALYFLLLCNSMRMDAEFRKYRATEHADLIPSKYEELAVNYQNSILTGIESTLYYYAGTIFLLGIPTVIGGIVYIAMKKFSQMAGLTVGFGAFLALQLGSEIWFTYPKPTVTEENRRAVEERRAQSWRPTPEPKKEVKKYPRALPGGGLDWSGVEGGPR